MLFRVRNLAWVIALFVVFAAPSFATNDKCSYSLANVADQLPSFVGTDPNADFTGLTIVAPQNRMFGSGVLSQETMAAIYDSNNQRMQGVRANGTGGRLTFDVPIPNDKPPRFRSESHKLPWRSTQTSSTLDPHGQHAFVPSASNPRIILVHRNRVLATVSQRPPEQEKYDTPIEKIIRLAHDPDPLVYPGQLPQKTLVLAGTTSNGKQRVVGVDRNSKETLFEFAPKGNAQIRSLAFSPTGKRLGASYADGTIVLWQKDDDGQWHPHSEHSAFESPVLSDKLTTKDLVGLSVSDKGLAVSYFGTPYSGVRYFDEQGGAPTEVIVQQTQGDSPKYHNYPTALSRRGSTLAVFHTPGGKGRGSQKGGIFIWSVPEKRHFHRLLLEEHSLPIEYHTRIAFHSAQGADPSLGLNRKIRALRYSHGDRGIVGITPTGAVVWDFENNGTIVNVNEDLTTIDGTRTREERHRELDAELVK